jgi:hypothetical protein
MFAVWGETILRLFEIEKKEEESESVGMPRVAS